MRHFEGIFHVRTLPCKLWRPLSVILRWTMCLFHKRCFWSCTFRFVTSIIIFTHCITCPMTPMFRALYIALALIAFPANASNWVSSGWMEWASISACACANAARAHYGLHALHVHWELTRIAAHHAALLARHRQLRHQVLQGLHVWTGASWSFVRGENIAVVSTSDGVHIPHDMCIQWLNSPHHRANILSSDVTHCGVAFAVDQYGAWWGVQLFA